MNLPPPLFLPLPLSPPTHHCSSLSPSGLTLEEEDALTVAFSTVTFHSCVHWGWDSRKLIFEQLWVFLLFLLRRVHPDFVPLHTKALCFELCSPHTAILHLHMASLICCTYTISSCSPTHSQSICRGTVPIPITITITHTSGFVQRTLPWHTYLQHH